MDSELKKVAVIHPRLDSSPPGAARIHDSNIDASFSGRIVLLNVNTDARDVIANEIGENVLIDEMSSPEQFYVELEQMREKIDVVVLGMSLNKPVSFAQHIHSMGREIAILILTKPERHEQLQQAIQFAPFLGDDITSYSLERLDELPAEVMGAVVRVQKRRTYRGNLAAAQKRLSGLHRERPQVTHYLDRLLEHAPIGVLNVDIRGTILNLNRRASQILNVVERDTLGCLVEELFPQPERSRLRDLVAQCVAPNRHRSPEVFDIGDSVDQMRYVEVVVSSLVDRSGQLGATIILQDVTDRVIAEREREKVQEALRASESRYRELVQAMGEGLALTDNQHIITYVNESFCTMFGYSCDEVIGRPLLSLVHDDDKEMMRRKIAEAAQQDARRFETAWVTKQGAKIYILTSPKQIFDPEERYLGCLGVFTDVTERKQREKLERQHMVELAHVSRVSIMGAMVAQITHELAQPLTGIDALSAGSLKLMKNKVECRTEILESLTEISGQAKRARDIIVRLRNFVRYHTMKQARIDLNGLVRTVVQLIGMESRSHNMSIRQELLQPIPDVSGDKILLEQVVLNLVRNAIEAMWDAESTKRCVTIRTSQPTSDMLEIAVCDTGPGISDEQLQHIFEPFFTTKADGLGMGLAISRSVVDAHGGRLSAGGNEHGGATFRVSLPITVVDDEFGRE